MTPEKTIAYIGSVSTPIKRALVEMLMHGALRRERCVWISCTDVQFYDRTIIAAVSRNLAIISVNNQYAHKQFVRLNQIGTYVAKAVLAERQARELATELSPAITSGERQRDAEVFVP